MGKCALLRIILRLIMHPYAHIFGLYTEEESDPTPQNDEESEPAQTPAVIVNVVDDDEPLPPPPSSGRPDCEKCGGPNFSLTSPYCLICRIG